MPVPTSISELSTTAGSNSPSGSDSPTVTDDHVRAGYSFIAQHRDGAGFTQEATVASASTADIGAASSLYVQITGTTTITSFGTAYNGPRFVRFAGILTLTHNATTLILPGVANITTAAGDTCVVVPTGNAASGWRVIAYERANGAPIAVVPIASGGTGSATASAARTALGTNDADNITTGDLAAARITTALNASGSAPIYACRAWVNFNGTGTPAIRASGNVSSITDNGTGDYTVNFTTAMPDANYAPIIGLSTSTTIITPQGTAQTTTACRVVVRSTATGTATDTAEVSMAFFR